MTGPFMIKLDESLLQKGDYRTAKIHRKAGIKPECEEIEFTQECERLAGFIKDNTRSEALQIELLREVFNAVRTGVVSGQHDLKIGTGNLENTYESVFKRIAVPKANRRNIALLICGIVGSISLWYLSVEYAEGFYLGKRLMR